MTLVWRPGFQFDADASTYIEAVEAADTQALETGVRYAINDFVIGCKQDGIWSAIKASCILAGARKKEGAFIDLKTGTQILANNGFVDGDYDRKTGLLGNGTKTLDSNRKENDQDQNNLHTSAYITTAFPANQYILFGTDNSSASGFYRGSTNVSSYNRNSAPGTTAVSSTGFVGASRSASASFIGRVFGTQSTTVVGSTTSNLTNFFLFGAAGSSSNRGTGRLAFYSIGESLDLTKLDGRVTDLITAFQAPGVIP